MSNQTEQRDPIEVLGEEFLDRHRRGERPSVEAYESAHPELAEGIRHWFPTMLAMEQFKGGKLASAGQPVLGSHDRPEQLGDYRIIREIGRGGMGVVYEAEQESLGRRVAVKVFPKQTLLDLSRLRRFHREARTAARLHHTNIVPVFGVGEQDGLHYIVMQRIMGCGLDTFLDGVIAPTEQVPNDTSDTRRAALQAEIASQRERAAKLLNCRIATVTNHTLASPRSIGHLALLRGRKWEAFWRGVAEIGIQVAEALEYAHAEGVLHRDIKPGNLLRDAKGNVWIADFGLATAVEAERLSNPGDLVGTLRFIAPEVINGKHDARSDIYGLGLTLYELLTLQAAYDEPHRHQLVQRILKGDLKPPRRIRPEIPRDLEAIVVKAAAREPKRRYQSAAELANDLRRFVQDRAVHARPIGSVGRLARWTRRNPLVGTLCAVLLLVIVGAFVGITIKWRESAIENRRAEGNLSIALDSMDHLLERYASSWMAQPMDLMDDQEAGEPAVGFQIEISDHNAGVLQDALRFYDQFATHNATNPKLQRDTARVHRRVGDIYQRLGQSTKAEEAYLRALQVLNADLSTSPSQVIERAITLNQLGLAMHSTSRFEEASRSFRQAEHLLQSAHQADSPVYQYELARTKSNLGQVLPFLPGWGEAGNSRREAISLLEGLVKDYPQEVDYRLALARAYRGYYSFSLFRGRGGDSERIRTAGISILEQLVQEFPGVPDYQCELSEMLLTASRRRRGADKPSHQSQQLQRSVDLARRLADNHPSVPRYRAVLARALKEQGESLERSRPEQADELFEESVSMYRSLADDFSSIPTYQVFLAMALEDRADNLQALHRTADAFRALDEAMASQMAYLQVRPDNRFGKLTLLRQYQKLTSILRELGRHDDADRLAQQAEALRSVLPMPHPPRRG